ARWTWTSTSPSWAARDWVVRDRAARDWVPSEGEAWGCGMERVMGISSARTDVRGRSGAPDDAAGARAHVGRRPPEHRGRDREVSSSRERSRAGAAGSGEEVVVHESKRRPGPAGPQRVIATLSSGSEERPYARDDLGAVELDAPQEVGVRLGPVGVLQVEAGEPERAHRRGDLGGHGLGGADEEGAVLDLGLELVAGHRSPPALGTDPVAVGLEVRVEQVARL